MKKLNTYQFILLLGILLLASCTDERYEVNDTRPPGETIEVPFTFTVDKMLNIGENDIPLNGDGLLTRTVPEDLDGNDGTNAKVKKMTFIQFNAQGFYIRKSEATIVGTTVSVDLTKIEGLSKLIVLANTPAKFSDLSFENNKFDDAVKRTVDISAESDLYYTNESGENYLFMSGLVEEDLSNPTGGTLEIAFKRNVARLTLNLQMTDSRFTLKSVRLRNIPQKIYLADQLVKTGDRTAYDGELMDYELIKNFDKYKTGTTYSFSWYVPCNEQGIVAGNSESKQKTIDKKPNATYYEFVVEDETGYQATFSIVPGSNNTNDYNVTPNKKYATTLTIQGLGADGGDDGRIDNVTTFEGYSNSYILNPPANGTTRTYVIPIKQVYEYWKGTSPGYGNNTSLLAGAWTVSYLWNDKGLTTSSENLGTGTFDVDAETGTFEVKIKTGDEPCNYVVALKNSSNTILWSWHLWVTDYNPDGFTGPIEADKYKYEVYRGSVNRYGGTGWTSGSYKNSVMMDRNLGALKDRPEYVVNGSGQLYYQFGRKDPFHTGHSIFQKVVNQVTIAETIQNPRTYYGVGPYWTSDTEVLNTSYPWFDAKKTDVIQKSIYDPCPEGWKLPVYNYSNECYADFEDKTTFPGKGMSYVKNDKEVAWFPTMGIMLHYGTVGSINLAQTAYWFANMYIYSTTIHGWRTTISSDTFNSEGHESTSLGHSVRCVKMDAVSQ
ncbi:MAG: hypothetical protein ACK5LF_23365 [Bacteroides xylanisolvens]